MDEVKQENTPKLEKLYEYTVTRYKDGRYDINGVVLDGAEHPSIDRMSAAKDLIEFGDKLEKQLMREEIDAKIHNTVIATINQLLAKSDETDEAGDPTQA